MNDAIELLCCMSLLVANEGFFKSAMPITPCAAEDEAA